MASAPAGPHSRPVRTAPLGVLLLALALPASLLSPGAYAGQGGAPAEAEGAGLVHLDCQVAGGPWQPCDMQVESVGESWKVLVGPHIYEFLHDGTGTVRMRQAPGSAPWRTVESSWTADAALCWDGLCARGDIPLD